LKPKINIVLTSRIKQYATIITTSN